MTICGGPGPPLGACHDDRLDARRRRVASGSGPGTRSWFPFVSPWDDALKGTATDVSFLNDGPAGKYGPIVVRGGKFVESASGKRIRFFGTNGGARAAFPSMADADHIAVHMAKLGINAERTCVSDQRGTGPSIAEAIPAEIAFRHSGPLKAWALDGRGRRVRLLTTTFDNGFVGLNTDGAVASMWVELAPR